MPNNYLDAILSLEPDYEVSVIGDPSVYSNINWGSETPINQATLDSVIASATLNQAKNKKKIEMRSARNEALSRYVPYSGNDHEMTAPALAYLAAAVAHVAGGGSLPVSFAIATVSGGSVIADAAYVKGLLSNTLTQQKNHVDTYAARCASIDAAADVATVEAIVW